MVSLKKALASAGSAQEFDTEVASLKEEDAEQRAEVGEGGDDVREEEKEEQRGKSKEIEEEREREREREREERDALSRRVLEAESDAMQAKEEKDALRLLLKVETTAREEEKALLMDRITKLEQVMIPMEGGDEEVVGLSSSSLCLSKSLMEGLESGEEARGSELERRVKDAEEEASVLGRELVTVKRERDECMSKCDELGARVNLLDMRLVDRDKALQALEMRLVAAAKQEEAHVTTTSKRLHGAGLDVMLMQTVSDITSCSSVPSKSISGAASSSLAPLRDQGAQGDAPVPPKRQVCDASTSACAADGTPPRDKPGTVDVNTSVVVWEGEGGERHGVIGAGWGGDAAERLAGGVVGAVAREKAAVAEVLSLRRALEACEAEKARLESSSKQLGKEVVSLKRRCAEERGHGSSLMKELEECERHLVKAFEERDSLRQRVGLSRGEAWKPGGGGGHAGAASMRPRLGLQQAASPLEDGMVSSVENCARGGVMHASAIETTVIAGGGGTKIMSIFIAKLRKRSEFFPASDVIMGFQTAVKYRQRP